MEVRIKSYQTMSEAISDQALLNSKGITATLQNTQDIHPTLIGQVFLVVEKKDYDKARSALNYETSEGSEDDT